MTFTVTATTAYVSAAAVCFGGSTGSTIDQSSSANSGGSTVTSLQPGSITPGHANEVVIAVTDVGNGTSPSINSGFTSFGAIGGNGSTFEGIMAGYLIQTTATAENPTSSWTGVSQASAVIGSYQ